MDSQTLGTIASFASVAIILFNWRRRGRWTRADHLPQVRLEEQKRRHSRGNDALQELEDPGQPSEAMRLGTDSVDGGTEALDAIHDIDRVVVVAGELDVIVIV